MVLRGSSLAACGGIRRAPAMTPSRFICIPYRERWFQLLPAGRSGRLVGAFHSHSSSGRRSRCGGRKRPRSPLGAQQGNGAAYQSSQVVLRHNGGSTATDRFW
eukprot:TRINITY_DN10586_c0_g1_i1.p1 TRINITY_DN10586_c0_g1~~TRINITY_DN10586_c0_g1_i1.p1  ORF type:complete len:118 (+),score=0.33 TRINITY_DN10586_c0_g1_i1:47-355(+)